MNRSKTRAPLPFITPMAAQLVAALPEVDEWVYEVKLDGFRALVLKDGSSIAATAPSIAR